jgi:YcxB-like protein
MVIHYQNTFAEFSEASDALGLRNKKKRKKRGSPWLVIAIATYFFLIMSMRGWLRFINAYELYLDVYAPLILSMVEVILIVVIASLLRGKLPRIRWRIWISLLPFTIGMGLWVLIDRINRSAFPSLYGTIWYERRLLPHMTWLFFVGLFTVIVLQQLRKKRQLLWEQQPQLHRAKTAEITAEGVTVSDMVSRTEWRWQGFVGWEETKGLFLLFPSEIQVLLFPKQAFAAKEEVAAMRALCGLIPDPTPSAFQIETSALPPPLPEIGSRHGA